jgi:hypothetical protein
VPFDIAVERGRELKMRGSLYLSHMTAPQALIFISGMSNGFMCKVHENL